MAGRAQPGIVSLLASFMFLLCCNGQAITDTELLMQAPFAHDFGWTDAADLCNSERGYISCDGHGNVLNLRIQPPLFSNIRLPADWGKLLHLQVLELARGVVGDLPAEWGNDGCFQNLKTLSVALSNVSGSLPAEWGSNHSFPQLNSLVIFLSSLSGSLPPSWGSNGAFPQLTMLGLSNNHLTGSLPPQWGRDGAFPQLNHLSLESNILAGSLPPQWGSKGAFPQLAKLDLTNNRLTGSLPPEWGSNGAFLQLQVLSLQYNELNGSLPVEWGVPANFSILEFQNDFRYVAAAPFRSLGALVLWHNQITGAVPLEWINNPHFVNAIVVINQTLFLASKDLSNFTKGVCLEPSRYKAYRKWAIGIVQSKACEERIYLSLGGSPNGCLIPVANTGLDPCLMDSKTKAAVIALWTCSGLVVLLVCLEAEVLKLLDHRFTGIKQSRQKAMAWIESRLWPRHRVLLGMVATVIAFWADIASDVPVLIESWQKGVYFYTLLSLMFGSHILDAILIARYAVAKGFGELGNDQQPVQEQAPLVVDTSVARRVWGCLVQKFHAVGVVFSTSAHRILWFMVYFFIALLALPALDVLGLANPTKEQPADAILRIDLVGYQIMRMVIGAIFRTFPTAIVLTYIAIRGNNPDNGTYFDATVVSVSLTLSAVQIIVVILQVKYRARIKKMRSWELLFSVFTLKGLEVLSDEGPHGGAEEGPGPTEDEMLPFCTTGPLPPPETPHVPPDVVTV